MLSSGRWEFSEGCVQSIFSSHCKSSIHCFAHISMSGLARVPSAGRMIEGSRMISQSTETTCTRASSDHAKLANHRKCITSNVGRQGNRDSDKVSLSIWTRCMLLTLGSLEGWNLAVVLTRSKGVMI